MISLSLSRCIYTLYIYTFNNIYIYIYICPPFRRPRGEHLVLLLLPADLRAVPRGCYTMPCETTLCYAMLCETTLCYAMPCDTTLCYAMLGYTILIILLLYHTVLQESSPCINEQRVEAYDKDTDQQMCAGIVRANEEYYYYYYYYY